MFRTAVSLFIVIVASASLINASVTPLRLQGAQLELSNDLKVPVVLGVRSRDMNALLCQFIFDEVLTNVMNKIDLSFAYVEDIDPSNDDFGVSCPDGPSGCAGDVQQLCVYKYAEFSNWWQFVMCQNYQHENIGSVEVAASCAQSSEVDLDESGINQCLGSNGNGVGAEGAQLLQENAKATRNAGIDTSCTVVINHNPVCVHDGIWKECEEGHTPVDFERQINDEWNRINSFVGL